MTSPEPLPRWILTMADGSDTLTFTINPNQADSQFVNDQPIAWQTRGGLGFATEGHGYQFAGLRNPGLPQVWTFGGFVYDQDQYNNLLEWSRRPGLMYLRTDLGEVMQIRLNGIQFNRKAPVSPRHVLRQEYVMNALIYEYSSSGNLTIGTSGGITAGANAGSVLITGGTTPSGASATVSATAYPGRVSTSTIAGLAATLTSRAYPGTVTGT